MSTLSLLLPLATAASPVMELPGPYELEGSILAILQFIFTFMIVIGKFKAVRITSSFLTAILGGSALVVYYINQTTVGNPLSLGPIAMFGGGVIYGTIIGVIMVVGVVKKRKMKKEIAETAASAPPVKRRFED